ncbi:MAG: hypothetical protein WCJ61_04575 [Paludibacter sp.]
MTYIVTFEIDNQIRKDNFKNKLKEFEACCPIHDNAWAVYTEKQDFDIIQEIKDTLIKKDRLFVMKTDKHASWINPYGDEHVEWMMNNL